MRKRSLKTVYELARKDSRVLYMGSDLGKGTLSEMQKEIPGQFFMEGIAEANLIGMAAGLAMNGKIPFVNTIATFLTRRCYDQIAVDMCLGNHNVRLIANGGGVVYAPLGPTHLATDDIALMRVLPNMAVIVPADADEMERAIRASQKHQGPIYFRVARGGDPSVDQANHGFKIGRANVLREPGDVLLIATGILVHTANRVADKLEKEGIPTGVINVHTIKPLDRETLTKYLLVVPNVFTLEEHSLIGGLGSAVAELVAQGARHSQGKFKILGIPDQFPDKYGRQENLLQYFGLDEQSIFTTVQQILSSETLSQ